MNFEDTVCECKGVYKEYNHFFGTGSHLKAWKCDKCNRILTSDGRTINGKK